MGCDKSSKWELKRPLHLKWLIGMLIHFVNLEEELQNVKLKTRKYE